MQHRKVDSVLRDKLATADLGVLSITAHRERALHAHTRIPVAADDDAYFKHPR
jgi:hypothetical protein